MKYRQGDVLIKKVESIQGKKLKHLVLAEGETTGHKHQITEGDAEMYEHEGTLFLRVNSAIATVTHEEHAPIVLPIGDYEIKIKREYSPSGWVSVQD